MGGVGSLVETQRDLERAAERAKRPQRLVDRVDRRIATEDKPTCAEGLQRELERPLTVRRCLEPHVRRERRAWVQSSSHQPLDLKGRAAGEQREDDTQLGPASDSRRDPRRVGRLHLIRVRNARCPPAARGRRGRPRMDE